MNSYALSQIFETPFVKSMQFFQNTKKNDSRWRRNQICSGYICFHRDTGNQILSNVDNENGGAWTENWKQNLLYGWIPQSLHRADIIYGVVATVNVYYIYKYKHLHLACYKCLLNNFRYQWTLILPIPNQCHNWTSWTRISSNFDNQNTRRNIPVISVNQ